jgi:cytochrome b6-f complex iron-sulfur subunit
MSITNNTNNNNNNDPARRSFLGVLGGIFLGLITAAMGVISSVYVSFPAFSNKTKKDKLWHTIKPVDQIPTGTSKHTITLTKQTGWAVSETEQIVWIVKQDQSVNIFSAICPHEGCIVNKQANDFVCLCHMSQWKEDGTKVSGPTPRDLDKLDHRVNNNNLEVNYQAFKTGTSQKIPLS